MIVDIRESQCKPLSIERGEGMTLTREMLSPEDVCKRLNLPSPATLYSQRYRGVAPGCLAIKVGRHLRWDLDDLEAWVEEQKRRQ